VGGVAATGCKGLAVAGASTTIPNCSDCNSPGKYLEDGVWKSGSFVNENGGGNGNVFELSPGVYTDFTLGNADRAYMNPGVYTFTGSVSFDKGTVCVYGAPTCDSGVVKNGCGDTAPVFLPNSASGNTWYYNCSPYGFWYIPKATMTVSGHRATGAGSRSSPGRSWPGTWHSVGAEQSI
jgi:hypothetical protein